MALNHNKKRNSNLLREFFSRHMAECIVAKNNDKLKIAHNIWKKYVRNGTELQKEMKLSSALNESKFANREIALKFLTKIKEECTKISHEKLEQEKTALIREVNNKIYKQVFYEANINNYTELASIHLLLNSWIKESAQSLEEQAQLEDKVLNFLCTLPKEDNKVDLNLVKSMMNEEDVASEVNGLVVNIMNEKMNERFSSQLSEEQKYILRQFIFDDDQNALKDKLANLRKETLEFIGKEAEKNKNTKNDKLSEIKNLLEEEYKDTDDVNETNVIFYLSVSKLLDDLKDR